MTRYDHVDVDLYESKEDAVQAALDNSEIGEHVVICRGDWSSCATGDVCPMCARVTVTDGMTAADALAAAQAFHA